MALRFSCQGQAVPGSDADIVVVLKKDTRLPKDRLTEYVGAFAGVGVPVEVLAYTQDEIDAMCAEGNLFIRAIVEHRLQLA